MKALSPFPHDPSYDADFANGEIFDTDKPLPDPRPSSSIPDISQVSPLVPVGALSTVYMNRPRHY